MPQAHKTSFLIILALTFLLPLFFIPGGALFLESAKSALLGLGLVAALLVFLFELWPAWPAGRRQGSVTFPKHAFLVAAAALPLVYLLSALLSTPTALSLFGYHFEVGTFGYMLMGSLLLILSSVLFIETARALQVLMAFFFSISILAVFMATKILVGPSAWLGANNMANPIGLWTDLSIIFALLSLFSTLTLGMIPMRPAAKWLLYGTFILSTALTIVISFSTALALTLVGSVLLLGYFSKVERDFLQVGPAKGGGAGPLVLPIILALISALFLWNPSLSATQGTLSNVVSKTFNIENTDVRPSFSATLSISKAVLSQTGLLGSGPNTFGHDWLIYKPVDVNATPFWGVAFPFGAGFVPTQVASTGMLGTAVWLSFFVLLIMLAAKALIKIPESRAERFVAVSALLGSLFLWSASFFYAPSSTVLILAFIFSGLLVAALTSTQIIPLYTLPFHSFPQVKFFSSIFLILSVAAAGALGFITFEKTAAAYHWKKAVDLSNTLGTPLTAVEGELEQALQSSPHDIYYVALSRVNFAKAQAAAQYQPTTDDQQQTTEQNQAIFENSLQRSIEAARLAVNVNPASYENWIALGAVYSALVPEPLKVEGAYENALFAYNEAYRRNPNNPELPLLISRLELSKGNVEAARSYIRRAIALKEDYADAYLMLAQLEVQAGNASAALDSAERLAFLRPNNPGIHFELGLLKYSGKDYPGAEQAFRRALVLSPDYANAKYYLGLTLIELNRLAEAQAEFEDLAQTNPDNPEVMTILQSLRQGKRPPLNRP